MSNGKLPIFYKRKLDSNIGNINNEQQVQSYADAGMEITSREDVDKVTPLPVYNGLYQILLAMKYLRSSDEEWTVFVNAFGKLIQNNGDVVSFAAMNLPIDWKDHLSV